MGWHIGMSYEDMEREFGSGAKEDSSEKADSSAPAACPLPTNPDGSISSKPPAPPEDHQHVYHLCRKQDWEAAKESQTPYFPRTFLKDGKFTRASLFLDDIADVANEYYSKNSPPDEKWIVLELNVQFLYHGLGIPVLAAIAPETKNNGTNALQCLQVFGGISTHPSVLESLVTAVYTMKRRDIDGKFVGMLAAAEDRIGPATPRPTTPKECKTPKQEEEEEDVLEISNEEETNQVEPTEDAAKTKKKKKGFFSKLKTKK